MSIEFKNVSKKFGDKVILNNVSFTIHKGEILFILGKSGVGKSVTLKHIVGLLHPDSGEIFVDQTSISSLAEDDLVDIRKKCGMVFQHPALLDSLSIFDNISFGLDSKTTLQEKEKTALRLLDLVQLTPEILELFPPEISYGMQKRVSLARTLAPSPNYLLFDEPTTGLDPITTNSINDLIYDLSRKLQVTSVVVSHDMGCALKIADRILVLDQGRILSLADVETTKKSDIPLIKDFLSEVLASEETP